MSKFSKQDFDEFLGKEPFYSDHDKHRFFKRNNQPSKKRNWLVQLATIALAFGILFIGLNSIRSDESFFNFNANENNIGPSLSTSIEIAETKQEVDEYYERKTPGLSRAMELGLVKNVNKTVSLTDDTTLKIEKIWYSSDEMFIFYNTSLSNKELLENKTGPSISQIKLHPDDQSQFLAQYLTLYTKNIGPFEGIVYNNRFYHRIVALPIQGKNQEELQQIDETVLADITVKLFEEQVKVSDIPIPLQFDVDKEQVYTTTLNKTIENQQIKITFNQIDVGVTKNYLYGEIELPKGQNLREIRGEITTDTGDKFQIFGHIQTEDAPTKFVFETQAFNSAPSKVNVNIDSVSLVGDDSFTFSLDVSDYAQLVSDDSDQYEKQLHRRINEIKDTTIYLERLYYDDRGINFDILYEAKSQKQNIQLLESTPITPDEQERRMGIKLPNEVSAINELGDKAEYGQRGTGPGSQYGIFLAKEFIESSKKVDVTIDHLLYKIEMNQSINFSVTFEEE